MKRETLTSIKERKARAAVLVAYANPKSRKRPTMGQVLEILVRNIPYRVNKPVIDDFDVTAYHMNHLIKSARYMVTLTNGQKFEITAYQHLKGRTPEEKAADKIAEFPSGLFQIFHSEVK